MRRKRPGRVALLAWVFLAAPVLAAGPAEDGVGIPAPWLSLSARQIEDIPAADSVPGSDPRGWRLLGAGERYPEVYAGVDLLVRPEADRLSVALLLKSGEAGDVHLDFPEALGLESDGRGHAILRLQTGDVALVRPGLVQESKGEPRAIGSGYRWLGEGRVGLTLGAHEPGLPVVVAFDVVFLKEALPRLDRNHDGRVELRELAPEEPRAPEGGPVVLATKADSLAVDVDNDTQADPGDTLRYDIDIANTGTTGATGVTLTDPIEPNLAEVPGSVNVSPLAFDDAYPAFGNVTLVVTDPLQGLFANDTDFLGDTSFALTNPPPGVPTPTTGGGTIAVNADGTFSYTTAPGASSGTDTSTYTLTDSGGLSGTGTVTFSINGRVWFVKADVAGPGTGTQADPFKLLSALNGPGGAGDPDAPNDIIYLYDTAALPDYTGGLELETGQRLVGSGVPLVVGATTVLPAGTPPVVVNAGGNGISLASDVTIQGLSAGSANDAGIAGSGALGTLSLDSVTINTSATGAGLSLTNQTGSLTFNGSIGGNGSGAALVLSGGAGSVTLSSAPISKTAGQLVDVQGKTGGTVTLGSVSGTGAATDAIVVQGNTGGTLVAFGSGFSVTTTSGRGLFANNGGTIDVGGTSSTISATGGAALDVTGTSFGAGVTLASASSTGSSAEGLKLANVTGPVTINGGAINGSTGAAFSLAQGSANVTYAGTISKTSAGRAVDVQTRAGGTAAFSGAITATGASTGINVSGATAVSTVTFTGAVDLGTAGTRLNGGTALTVNHGATSSTTSFTDLHVFTTGQAGIDASNGGTLNITTGSLDAGGRGLNLGGLALGATLTSVVSSGSAAQGVRLDNATGSLSIGTTSITGPATEGILVQASAATVNFASSGATAVSGGGTQRILVTTSTGNVSFGNTTLSGGTDGVSLQNNSAGTRSFGTLAISGNGGAGFLHAVGGGATSVTGATTITNPGGAGIDIQNSTTPVTFNGVTVNKGATGGTGVILAANTTAPSFGTLAITTSNGTGLASSNSGIVNSGGSIAATSAPAIDASATAFSSAFATVSSTGSGAQGINLSGPTGTLTMGGGAITGSAGTAFNVTGGNAAVTYSGTVTVTNGQSGLVTSNVTGGSLVLGTVNVSGIGAGRDAVAIDGTGAPFDVTISAATLDTSSMRHGVALGDLGAGSDVTITGGTITSTGAGRRVVNFAGPTNGTYTFSGVTLSASGSQGLNFAATQSGTYLFRDLDCGTPAGGVCVTANGTNAAVTLRAVSQSGGSIGISLFNTTGSFTVTGNGGTCTAATPTCTGGTIGTTAGADGAVAGAGVWVSSASNVSLARMRFHDHPNFAIRGQNVTSFSLDNSVVNGANGTSVPSREGSVVFDGLFGTSALANSTISGGIEDNLRVENTTATPLTALNVTGTGGTGSSCRILNNSTVSGNIGFRLAGFNNAVMTATVSGCLFQGNRTDSINVDAANTASVTTTITNNTIIAGTAGANQGNLGIDVTSGATGVHGYTVGNNLVGTDGVTPAPLINTGVNLFSGNASTLGSATVGFVTSNTVRNAGAGSGHGIQAFQDLGSTLRANINANTVSNVALDFGLRVEAAGDPAGAGGNVQAGVTNNNVTVLATALDAIRVRSRRQTTLCSEIRANAANAGGAGFFGLFTNQSNTSTFSIEGLALGAQTAATTQTYLIGQNPAAATVSATAATNYNGVAANACSIP